ncbi:hypothetical protein OOT46_17890 [Aquabacterium sp. A7-Y]|uniref:cation efflux protein, CzcI family n=1 Tax=Aquabacterium sp. A7-Y TaxID=1349605 RepID=UPI00223CA934|nr:cation efflux protein, CzcI family [Aquabacterium sp. A7-Y]MCW7539713.1 hypothetical protein [Aquabacterium sp. A7-Y]
MRRWLAIFLWVLLPLQFSWAAAAAYCGHESGTAAHHFGHHEHAHHAAESPQGDGGMESAKLFGIDDVDCACCHFGCAKPITPALALPLGGVERAVWVTALPGRHDFQLAERIERPNWHRA